MYTTLALVKAELRSDEFTADTIPSSDEVTDWILEADEAIELMSGEVFSSTSVSSTYMDYDSCDSILRLPDIPLISVDEVRYNKNYITSDEANWVTLEEGQGKNYLSYLDSGEIEFINGNNATNKIVPVYGKRKFCVSYTKGHSTVPYTIRQLSTLMVARRVISTLINSQSNTEGGEVQVGPIAVKDPSSFSPRYISNMDDSIKSFSDKIGLGFKSFRSRRVYE